MLWQVILSYVRKKWRNNMDNIDIKTFKEE